MNEEDVSYLDIPQPDSKEKVWCKIGETGNLEFVDWDIIKGMAESFDQRPPQERTEQMLIAKLMWLTREETRKEFDHAR